MVLLRINLLHARIRHAQGIVVKCLFHKHNDIAALLYFNTAFPEAVCDALINGGMMSNGKSYKENRFLHLKILDVNKTKIIFETHKLVQSSSSHLT